MIDPPIVFVGVIAAGAGAESRRILDAERLDGDDGGRQFVDAGRWSLMPSASWSTDASI